MYEYTSIPPAHNIHTERTGHKATQQYSYTAVLLRIIRSMYVVYCCMRSTYRVQSAFVPPPTCCMGVGCVLACCHVIWPRSFHVQPRLKNTTNSIIIPRIPVSQYYTAASSSRQTDSSIFRFSTAVAEQLFCFFIFIGTTGSSSTAVYIQIQDEMRYGATL